MTTLTTKKIWQMVVVAGAMLGTPLAARADKAADVDAKNTIDRENAKIQLTALRAQRDAFDLKIVDAKIARAVKAVEAARSDDERKAARAILDKLRKERATRTYKVTPLERLEQSRSELVEELTAAVDATVAAENDADRASGKARVDKLRKELAVVDGELAAEHERLRPKAPAPSSPQGTNAPMRPRTPPPSGSRPKGRGFVLA